LVVLLCRDPDTTTIDPVTSVSIISIIYSYSRWDDSLSSDLYVIDVSRNFCITTAVGSVTPVDVDATYSRDSMAVLLSRDPWTVAATPYISRFPVLLPTTSTIGAGAIYSRDSLVVLLSSGPYATDAIRNIFGNFTKPHSHLDLLW